MTSKISHNTPASALDPSAIAAARREYEGRVGQAVVMQRGLMLWAISASAVSVAALIAIWFMLPLKTIQPYIVEVNKLSGEARAIEPATAAKNYEPDIATRQFWLAQFVVNALTIDPRRDVTEKQIESAASVAKAKASSQLTDYMRKTQPIRLIMEDPNFSRRVEVRSVVFVRNTQTATVQVRTRDQTVGRDANVKNYIIKVDYAFKQPDGITDIVSNPIGMYVIDFSINEDI